MPRLGKASRAMVAAAHDSDQLGVSAISFWEIAMLIAKRRLRTLTSAGQQRAKMLAQGIRELPLNGDIAVAAVALEGLHADPADRFIVATAMFHSAMLLTADAALLRWDGAMERHNAVR